MKKLFTTTIFTVLIASAMAQAPQRFSFQAVVRNNVNELLLNKPVGMRTTILQGNPTGTIVYQEFYYPNPQTNANGLVTLEIGSGFVLSGNFANINWANGPYFIKTEADPTGGTNYTITGTSQLMSVPYALHAKTAESITGSITETDPVFNAWDKSTGIAITEGQITDLQDYLTEEADGDPTNELQTVTQEDYQVTLSQDGGSFMTGVKSYTQEEIDAMTPYNGLTVINTTTNCVNYYILNNWYEACGTCTPQPSQADAGNDTIVLGGDLSVNLNANTPEMGEGLWTILSGEGGIFDDANDPQTLFTGQPYVNYTLQWAIATVCDTTYDEVSVTFNPWQCGMPITDERDDQTYETLLLDDQCWMAENLKYLPSVVGPGTGSNTTPYYYVYGYNGTSVSAAKVTANYQTYGALYNWPASLTACPEGWHLPSDAEWTALTTYVSSQAAWLCNSNISYIAKALASTTSWSTSSNTCAVGNNLAANNATGFSGLPGGNRTTSGTFSSIGSYGYWWSSTEAGAPYAWFRNMGYFLADVYRDYVTEGYGFSARCVRD